MRILYKMDPDGYHLAFVCGIAGVWDNTLCWDNPSAEVELICSYFTMKSGNKPEEQDNG